MQQHTARRDVLLLLGFFVTLVSLHWHLLWLPYFWDEAGYYIPAARDFFLAGHLIPTSTLTNAHPPLPEIYLALWWKLFGYSPLVTRVSMLLVAAFLLLQVFKLSDKLATRSVAMATTLLTALYPVVFAQSSLAHADLTATALGLWGIRLYFDSDQSRWKCIIAFALAALAKEIAIVIPLALFAWELLAPRLPITKGNWREISKWQTCALLFSGFPLALWFTYHYFRTGYVFGNPEFVRYNVSATIHPLRFLLAAIQRVWQVTGHMNLWVLTLAAAAAMLLPPLRENGQERPRIAIPVQLAMLAVITAHIIVHSIIGGALLSRYMMPAIPLVILICVSTLRRRFRQWPWVVALSALAFILGWYATPAYRIAPEDNLNYAAYVRLHQKAAALAAKDFSHDRVLTAWPASDELTKPYLGYVQEPLKVVGIENFSLEQIMLAKQSSDYSAALVFSTKYEPQRRIFLWDFWEKNVVRFFDYHRDLRPEAVAQILGGHIVWQASDKGEWIALIRFDRDELASLHR